MLVLARALPLALLAGPGTGQGRAAPCPFFFSCPQSRAGQGSCQSGAPEGRAGQLASVRETGQGRAGALSLAVFCQDSNSLAKSRAASLSPKFSGRLKWSISLTIFMFIAKDFASSKSRLLPGSVGLTPSFTSPTSMHL